MKIQDATKMPLDHSPNLLQMLGMTRILFTEHMLHQLCLMRRMTLSFSCAEADAMNLVRSQTTIPVPRARQVIRHIHPDGTGLIVMDLIKNETATILLAFIISLEKAQGRLDFKILFAPTTTHRRWSAFRHAGPSRFRAYTVPRSAVRLESKGAIPHISCP
jgi:hypothetical protein